jgi:peptide/nickel transport system substrate-binding protein
MKRLGASRWLLITAGALLVLAFAGSPAAADEPAPNVGGTARFGLPQEPSCLNAYLSQCFGSPLLATGPVLAGTYRQRPDFTYEPVLVDRVSVEHEASVSWFKLTYRLEQDAEWSDGTPVTAHDLAFTLETLLDPANNVLKREGYELITRTTVLDEKTVRFTFERPYPAWKTLFPQVLPKHVLEGRDFDTVWNGGITDPATGAPIGSGPFLLTGWDRGVQITLSRNPSWWGEDPPYLDSLVLRFIPDQAQLAQALTGGTIDASYPGGAFPGLADTPGIALQSPPGAGFEHVDFNVGSETMPLLREPWFREAIAYALDRQGAVTEVWGPHSPGIETFQSLTYLGQQPEYRPHFDRYSYDPERVGGIMRDHGCALAGDGIWSCAGTRASMRFATTTGNAPRAQFQARVQADARAAGLELVTDNSPAGPLFGTRLPERDYDLIMFTWGLPRGPVAQADLYTCDAVQNFMGYCSEPVTRLFEESDEETRESRHRSFVNRADAVLADDLASIPLFQRPSFLYSRVNLRGIEENPSERGPTWNAEEWSIG